MSERQKSNDFDKEIKNHKESKEILERLLNEKENSILILTKEKYELQSKLDFEKNKLESSNANSSSGFMNMFRRNSSSTMNNADYDKKQLIKENSELKQEVETIKCGYEQKCKDFDNIKIEYQNIINLQIDKIKKCENIISDKNSALDEINKKLNQMYENWKAIDMERVTYENKYFDLLKEFKIKEEKIVQNELVIIDK